MQKRRGVEKGGKERRGDVTNSRCVSWMLTAGRTGNEGVDWPMWVLR